MDQSQDATPHMSAGFFNAPLLPDNPNPARAEEGLVRMYPIEPIASGTTVRHGFVREAPSLGARGQRRIEAVSEPTRGKVQGLSQNSCIGQVVNEGAADDDWDASAS